MKRKFADRRDWKRILKKSYKNIYIQERNYRGNVSMLTLQQVKAPLLVKYDQQEVCIADDGYVWMQHFSTQLKYVLTSVYNNHGQAVQWYFDIVKDVGTTHYGVPYFDDLYLDVVALPSGEVFLLDENELQEALDRNDINNTEFLNAYSTANKVLHELKHKKNYLINANQVYYEFMMKLL